VFLIRYKDAWVYKGNNKGKKRRVGIYVAAHPQVEGDVASNETEDI
jgi:hypothetical protein